MTDARHRSFWHRAGPWAAAGVFVGIAAVEGCGGGGETTTSTSTSTGSTETSTSSSTGTGGTGGGTTTSSTSTSTSTGTGGTGGSHMASVNAAAAAGTPFDATPNSTGKTLYFTANGVNGLGVYQAPADGSNMGATAVYPTAPNDPNDPFIAPFGIAISSDDKTLFVADPGAGTADLGTIFVVPAGGGTPTALAGTDGTVPRGLDIVVEGGKDQLYFTGSKITAGMPTLTGVYSMPASGNSLGVVFMGPPFMDPSGIAVASNGDIYVIDTISSASNTAEVYVIPKGGMPQLVVSDLRTGYPAGAALSMDEKTLYVSGLNAATMTDRVVAIDVATKTATEQLAMEIGSNVEAGGLHRAKGADVFAWADLTAGGIGTVYRITFK
jgi:sugar lactone lactonase YvrE